MRRRTIGAGILLLLIGYGLKKKVYTPQHLATEEVEEGVVTKKRILKTRLPASIPPKKSQLIENSSNGPLYVISERSEEPVPDLEVEQDKTSRVYPYQEASWNPGAQNGQWSQRSRSVIPSSVDKASSKAGTSSSTGQLTSSPFYSVPQSSPSAPYKENEYKGKKGTAVVEPTKQTVPVCSTNLTGGTFQRPVEINLTCSTASTIKYCIGENYCCDPELGSVYTGVFQLGQASKNFCLSFAGTSIGEQLTSETKEAFYSFDPELPHLEAIHNKTHVQTTQLDTEMILRSNEFGSPHHVMGVVNLKSEAPSQSNNDCSAITNAPQSNYILSETSVAAFSPASQMNLFLTSSGLTYGENNLMAYIKSNLYSLPQYSCSHSKITLEDFYYVQTLPLDVLNDSNSGELYGGFNHISTMGLDDSMYRGPASEIGASPTLELRTGLISIFFDK